uniref:Transcription factor CBF/NF-Y/archaeal histone domain-containing protein n=1 Tax=Caenorhabditis japonica TaxID=281687 RepID=A0A8R1E1N2_CAEJA
MNSSGPLNPADVSLNSSYPSPIVVPLDFIDKQSQASREELNIDESGLYVMSKALEEFMRRILRESTNNCAEELTYDRIAEFIANSEFKALKEFFPERVRFADVMDQMCKSE